MPDEMGIGVSIHAVDGMDGHGPAAAVTAPMLAGPGQRRRQAVSVSGRSIQDISPRSRAPTCSMGCRSPSARSLV